MFKQEKTAVQWDGEHSILTEYNKKLEIRSYSMFNLYIRNLVWIGAKLLAFSEHLPALSEPGREIILHTNLQHPDWKKDSDRSVSAIGLGWKEKQIWISSSLSFHELNHLKYFIQ